MKQIQPNVFITNSKKLLYKVSPLKKAYPPDGLTITKLIENNDTDKKKLLTVYRNLIRQTKYLQLYSYFKKLYVGLIKVKIRQDYDYRKAIFFPNSTSLTKDEIFERLVNTVNFIHNATLDSATNKNARPESMEFKILISIIEFENSKALPQTLRSQFQDNFFPMEKLMELRQIERSWNMTSRTENIEGNLWWLNNGLFRNEICFDYLKQLQNILKEYPTLKNKTSKNSNFVNNMAYSILDFEKYIILLNEEFKLLL